MTKKDNNNLDYPFYNDNPPLKIKDIIILAIVPIFFTIFTFTPYSFPGKSGAYIFCFSQLLAFLYVARGKISLLIKKPKFIDFVRVIVTLILQYVVAIGLALMLKFVFNISANDNPVNS